jgi:hypothetical protein
MTIAGVSPPRSAARGDPAAALAELAGEAR